MKFCIRIRECEFNFPISHKNAMEMGTDIMSPSNGYENRNNT